VHSQNLAQRSTNVVVRYMTHLGEAGAYVCESGRTERWPDATRPTDAKERNPDRWVACAQPCHYIATAPPSGEPIARGKGTQKGTMH
jgi:hypothetical protein